MMTSTKRTAVTFVKVETNRTIEHTMEENQRRTTTMKENVHHQEIPAVATMTEEATNTLSNQLQGDMEMTALMIKMSSTPTRKEVPREVPRTLLMSAFQLIRPSRISNSVMSSAMTRLSKTDTARLKITESSNSVMLVPDPTKEAIP
jgi:hypothetical protein